MKAKQPKISVIMPVKPGGEFAVALKSLKRLDYPPQLIEVFLSFGFSPSRQRNEAVKMAKGEILYFIDNDVEIEKKTLKRVIKVFNGKKPLVEIPQARGFSLLPAWVSKLIVEKFFSGTIYRGEVGAVGGPNVWWRKEPFWAALTGIVLESFFAHFLMAARYRPIGQIRRASEKELILCNLAIKRDIFKKSGGFLETLYPNEENELLNRLERLGYQLIYHPGALVSRPRRESLGEILRAFFHYGRGRMEQIRVEGLSPNLIFFIPLIFSLYLLGLVFFHPGWFFTPLVVYLLAAFASALGFAVRRKKAYLSFVLPLAFLVAHLVYAVGILGGLFSDFKKRKREKVKTKVKILKIKGFGTPWSPA